MDQHLVEERISELERRLRQVEKPGKAATFATKLSSEAREVRIRFFGWAITAISLAGFATGWGSAVPVAGFFFACSLLIGIVLIISASGLIGQSDSYIQLAAEERAGKKVHAHAIHHRGQNVHTSRVIIKGEHVSLMVGFFLLAVLVGWAITLSVTASLFRVGLPALLLMLIGAWAAMRQRRIFALGSIVGLTILLFVAVDPLMALMAGLTGFAVIWIAAWDSQDIDVLSLAGFGLTLSAFGQVYWGVVRLTEPERVAAICAALMGLLLTSLCYAARRRRLDRRDSSQLTILLTPVLALGVIMATGAYGYLQNLLAGLMLVVVGYGAVAYVGWLSYKRLSYAKYFLSAALIALLLIVYLLLDPVSVALIWFVLAVVVLAAGFTLPSYTARMVGLGLLSVAVLHYLFTILGAAQEAGPLLLRDRVWLGLIVGLFLPALALWYQEARFKGPETRMVPAVTNALGATGFLILFAIAYLDVSGSYQSLSWLILAVLGTSFGRFTKLALLIKGGAALALVALVKLLGFDLFTMPPETRLLVLLLVAVLLIAIGFILPKRSVQRKVML